MKLNSTYINIVFTNFALNSLKFCPNYPFYGIYMYIYIKNYKNIYLISKFIFNFLIIHVHANRFNVIYFL